MNQREFADNLNVLTTGITRFFSTDGAEESVSSVGYIHYERINAHIAL